MPEPLLLFADVALHLLWLPACFAAAWAALTAWGRVSR